MSAFLEYYDVHYKNKLAARAETFRKIFELLEEKQKSDYLIVETGCARIKNNFGGDGMSTVLFDKFVTFHGGNVISVDIDESHCKFAQTLVSKKTKVFCDDSVKFLWNLKLTTDIDLLYLDSFDINFNDPHVSMLHHIKEFCTVVSKLNKGSIIAIDDNVEKAGKGRYVADLMDNLGYKKIIDDYQICWVL